MLCVASESGDLLTMDIFRRFMSERDFESQSSCISGAMVALGRSDKPNGWTNISTGLHRMPDFFYATSRF